MRLQYSNGVLSIEVAGRTRKIGEINNRTLSVWRHRDQHWMCKYNGYGFNEAVMRDNRLFDYVLIQDEDKEGSEYYLVSREDILKHGIIDQAEEFDKQIFVPLHTLRKINTLED